MTELELKIWDDANQATRTFRAFGEPAPHFIHEDFKGVLIFAVVYTLAVFAAGFLAGWVCV